MSHGAVFAALLTLLVLVGCGAESTPGEPGVQGPTAKTAPERAWSAGTKIGTVVAERPGTARLFELLQIDYCCGGRKTLAEAATARDLDVQRLLDVLTAMSGKAPEGEERDWTRAPLEELTKHIVGKHHAYLRRELPRLAEIVDTVARVHREGHPELAQVKDAYRRLHASLPGHLEREESVVFPAILDPSSITDEVREAMFAQLRLEHELAGGVLVELRELTKGYEMPDDACALYTQLFEGLVALERDLHTHVHLENNALLPRAGVVASK